MVSHIIQSLQADVCVSLHPALLPSLQTHLCFLLSWVLRDEGTRQPNAHTESPSENRLKSLRKEREIFLAFSSVSLNVCVCPGVSGREGRRPGQVSGSPSPSLVLCVFPAVTSSRTRGGQQHLPRLGRCGEDQRRGDQRAVDKLKRV